MPEFKLDSKGFTLVELLVTIAIIAILSAIGLVVYSSAIKQGHDSKRQSDLRSIQSALEQYNSDQGFYPFTARTGSGNCGLDNLLAGDNPSDCGTSFTERVGSSLSSSTKTYLNSLPQDPTGTTTRYKYQAIPATPCDNSTTAKRCTSYCLYAKLENPPSPVPSAPAGCTYPTDYNFAVTPP